MRTDVFDVIFDKVAAKEPVPYPLIEKGFLNIEQRERLDQFFKSKGYGKDGTAYIKKK